MEKIKLSLDVVNPSKFHNIGIELWLDNTKFFDNIISTGRHHVIHEFESEDCEHVLKIQLKNKTAEHTKIDNSGNIVEDALINIENIMLDEIDVTQIVYQLSQYIHDGNGHESVAVHPFYGHLGCNGYVQLSFASPVYMWLLESM